MVKKYKRYSNGKIQLDYLMISMSLLDDITAMCSDEDIGELVRALYKYEKDNACGISAIAGNGKWYVHSLLNLIEQKRSEIDGKSTIYRQNGSSASKKTRLLM